jgi:hypothetical protein
MDIMNVQTAKIVWLRALILSTFAISVLMVLAEPLSAADAGTLLKPENVSPLLGGTPSFTSTPQGMTGTWTGSNPKRKLLVLTYKNSRVPGEFAFMGANKNAQAKGNSKFSDESGIGDKAFSVQESFGVVFMVLKNGRLLQLQYWTGGEGTAQDVTELRPVVKKAVAAF